MKNFSLKTRANSRRNSKNGQIAKILFITAFAIVLIYFFGTFVGKVGSVITLPVHSLKSWFAESSATLPSYLRGRNELISEIQKLKEELGAQRGKNATVERMIRENEELRALLSVPVEEGVLAAVTARPPFLPYDAILIDQGTEDGITEGAVAYHAGGQAIGYISKAFTHGSLVTLFSTPGVSATAYVFGPDIYTTLYGEGGGVMRVSVPQGVEIKAGDLVILPSLEAGILGSIQNVETSPTQPVQNGYVISDIPIQSLHFVRVTKKAPEVVTYEEAQAFVEGYRSEAFSVDVPEEIIVDEHATGTEESEAGDSDLQNTIQNEAVAPQ